MWTEIHAFVTVPGTQTWPAAKALRYAETAGCAQPSTQIRDAFPTVPGTGGRNELSNLQGVCRPCNLRKAHERERRNGFPNRKHNWQRARVERARAKDLARRDRRTRRDLIDDDSTRREFAFAIFLEAIS